MTPQKAFSRKFSLPRERKVVCLKKETTKSNLSRKLSLTRECILVLENVFSNYTVQRNDTTKSLSRKLSLPRECFPLLENVFSNYKEKGHHKKPF